MTFPGLDLHAEHFSPDGNLSARGYENLMGTPSLDLLSVVVREATQNICDAAADEMGARASFRLRFLEGDQLSQLKNRVFHELPPEPESARRLADMLGAARLPVLEIADFGTTGLGGPTRADRVAPHGENPDFINFLRNVGAARDVEGGGGTYGFGKATFYRASRVSTILVDTLTRGGSGPRRRFMAAHLGGVVPGRFTGRYWWGRNASDLATVDPLTGEEAGELAHSLGMPARGGSDSGTTIMILAPHFVDAVDGDIEVIAGAIEENLLWYFWPRMMQGTPPDRRLRAEVAVGDDVRKVEEPERFGALVHLTRAMNALRASAVNGELPNGTEVSDIVCKRPRRHLGRLAFSQGEAKRRKWILPPETGDAGNGGNRLTSIIPARCHHVALMRPAELVVKYLVGMPDADPLSEWGGVFRCDDDQEVEQAFADSEPPAHDDWQPDALPKGPSKTYVRVALREIWSRVRSRFEDGPAGSGQKSDPLGRVSEALGMLVAGAGGDAAGPVRRTVARRSVRGKSLPLVTGPESMGLCERDGRICAEFRVEVHAGALGLCIEAVPQVVMEGRLENPDPATGVPDVLGWLDRDGKMLAKGAILVPRDSGPHVLRISVPGEVAISVRLVVHEEEPA